MKYCFMSSVKADTSHIFTTVAYPGILLGGGGSTYSVEDRENGDMGAVAP